MGFLKYIFIVSVLCSGYVNSESIGKSAIDQQLFEDVLDPELCDQQLDYLSSNLLLLLRFLDAGIRIPKGVLDGNFHDLGNYHQCLGITEETENWNMQGKYCLVSFSPNQNPEIDENQFANSKLRNAISDLNMTDLNMPWGQLKMQMTYLDKKSRENLINFQKLNGMNNNVEKSSPGSSPLGALNLFLSVCVPKTCTTQQFLKNILDLGLSYEEQYCRLPNDKPWVAADYVAIVIFSIFGFLVVLSTGYDIFYTQIRKDTTQINKLYQSFSVYTNTRRLVTYTPVPGAIECLDGIRTFAMIWVIMGHSFQILLFFPVFNVLDILNSLEGVSILWILVAPITVDTFLTLSGLLLVYTTAGKLTRSKLIKNLHLFYLNRYLRLIPLLGAMVLIQASFLNRTADGPYWQHMEYNTNMCREKWWTTLLHIQNWMESDPTNICLSQTWYLAVDLQLYIVSPLVLFWVLGKNRVTPWIAIVGAILLTLTGSTVFNFIMDFQSWLVVPGRVNLEDQVRYLDLYYMNTLTRASPFLIGMLFGYMLHINKGHKVPIPWIYAVICWAIAAGIAAVVAYSVHSVTQLNYNNQLADNLINSFIRPVWALGIGWMIFACEHGYAGPINWILSLRAWKVPSRLSYALYIVHFQLIFLMDSTTLSPFYFDLNGQLFKFLADLGLALIAAYVLTLLIDAPCSALFKIILGGRNSSPKKQVDDNKHNKEPSNVNEVKKNDINISEHGENRSEEIKLDNEMDGHVENRSKEIEVQKDDIEIDGHVEKRSKEIEVKKHDTEVNNEQFLNQNDVANEKVDESSIGNGV